MLNDPFSRLSEVPSFTLTSSTLIDGGDLPIEHWSGAMGVPGGEDLSPDLTWDGAPAGTRSFAVTVYDPDAPTGSGFWHWAVANIPANITQLPAGAGDDSGEQLPERAFQLRGDAGLARYVGAAPPAGHGPHRYYVTVHALASEDVGVPSTASPAMLGFAMSQQTLGRATLVVTGETPAA